MPWVTLWAILHKLIWSPWRWPEWDIRRSLLTKPSAWQVDEIWQNDSTKRFDKVVRQSSSTKWFDKMVRKNCSKKWRIGSSVLLKVSNWNYICTTFFKTKVKCQTNEVWGQGYQKIGAINQAGMFHAFLHFQMNAKNYFRGVNLSAGILPTADQTISNLQTLTSIARWYISNPKSQFG
jgi:hypothetical protein